MSEIGAAAIGVAAPRIKFFEIVAGGIRRAVGGEHDHTHFVVVRDRGESISQRFQQGLR